MPFQIKLKALTDKRTKADTCVVLIDEDTDVAKFEKTLPEFEGRKDALSILKGMKDLSGKSKSSTIITLPHDAEFKTLIILGVGSKEDASLSGFENLGGTLWTVLEKQKAEKICVLIDPRRLGALKDLDQTQAMARFANGLSLRSYRFDQYKSGKKDKPAVSAITLHCEPSKEAQSTYDSLHNTAQGVFLARNLVNTAPNDLYPDAYANIIKKELTPLGVKVEILDEKKMQKLGMEAILAVGMGSSRKPRMVIMHWPGAKKSNGKKAKPLAYVGKGVTFDTGGISLKPGAGMDEMKMDMGGSAAVVGAMKALALNKSSDPVVGIVGLAENMPSSTAYRPGDIIGSYAGKTIEVLNTDAEGRLVLADALAYVQDKYDPRAIIDLATLTGAMMIALGHEYCGTFCNNQALWDAMEAASTEQNEKLWRMPLDDVWRSEMESDIADLRNLAKSGRFAGACTAAGFLEHFIDKGRTWAHMDIAGTAWVKADKPLGPKYGTGFGVRTLVDVAGRY